MRDPARRSRTIGRAAAAAGLALAASGCASAAAGAHLRGGSLVDLVAPAQRHPVAAVSGRLLGGGTLSLRGLRGSVVVVNFWSSWCAPCRAEAAALERAYLELRARGVRVLGVDVRDDAAAAGIFRRVHGETYPTLVDEPGTLALAFPLPPATEPTTIVLDRSGREAARLSGPVTYTTLADLTAQVAAEPAR